MGAEPVPALSDILMPKLGLTMTEGLLAEWRVQPGDAVRQGDILFVVETDKIATEIEAAGDGEIRHRLVEAGETVPVGTPVARWTGEAPEAGEERATPPPPRVKATPLARRMAREGGLDLAAIKGSGPGQRIKAADVARVLASRPEEAPRAVPAGEAMALDRVRLTAARRLAEAKREIPHFYVGAAAEVSRLLALRDELNAHPGAARVTLTHAVVAAAGRALLEEPDLNRVWAEDSWVQLENPDVGVAIDTPRGLFAPVLANAGRWPLDVVASRMNAMVARAREGRLAHGEMSGGAITVSNVGMHGARFLVPIVNPGQSMILGVGAVESLFRPDPEGRPALRRELTLVLAADHRVLDGAAAAGFLARIVANLEQPLRLLRTPVEGKN
ncbi:2-oxo acid dehydrogenase subunit E2 [Roseomonas sp. ACRSG]|nr:2-oxo acid dehydrogenase subunit E2 [Roseomonas sp. ACRSG]